MSLTERLKKSRTPFVVELLEDTHRLQFAIHFDDSGSRLFDADLLSQADQEFLCQLAKLFQE